MEVINIPEGIEVHVEVIAIVGDVGLAERVRDGSIVQQCSLDGAKPREEGIIPARGEREVVIRLELEGKTDIALHKGVHEISSGEDGNQQQFDIDRLVEVY